MSSIDVVILAAGKGTRMKTSLPKVMHQVCGLTLIERAMRAALAAKPLKIIPVIGYQSDLVSKHIAEIVHVTQIQSDKFRDTTVESVVQEPQHGTGHAVQIAVPSFSPEAQSTLIISGDMPLIEQSSIALLINQFSQKNLDLGFFSVRVENPASFGRIVRDSNGNVTAIVEAKDCSEAERAITEINASVYLAKTSFLKKALASLTPNNAQGELYLPDIVSWGVKNSYAVEAFIHHDPIELLGANSISELAELENYRRQKINRCWMNQGVTFENSGCAYIDEDVVIEPDCYIGANSRLKGATHLAAGVHLDGDSLIDGSCVGEGAHLKLGCVIESTRVGRHTSVGPYAHLREGTILEDTVKVGNFVEIKKSTLKKGVKAGHLSYLGDAEIGEKTNIGAGTITCNYDGTRKSKTLIAANVFIGSNSSLVAPVEIGEGAFVGAGSVITSSVPANALGVARGRQIVKQNWASKKKEASKTKGD